MRDVFYTSKYDKIYTTSSSLHRLFMPNYACKYMYNAILAKLITYNKIVYYSVDG